MSVRRRNIRERVERAKRDRASKQAFDGGLNRAGKALHDLIAEGKDRATSSEHSAKMREIEQREKDGAESPPRLNKYTCGICNGHIITIDRVEGTTPFMIGCEATERCQGMMQSSLYRVDPASTPTFEWRKPSTAELIRLDRGSKEHVERGGLLLYPIESGR